MLAAERRRTIERLIQQQSSIQVEELATRLDASDSTIRRDLAYLEEQGVLKRTYGGAVPARPNLLTTSMVSIPALSPVQMRLGEAAARLIAEDETVFLGPGTLTLAVACHLADQHKGTIITHALDIAAYLAYHSALAVILTGGQVERQDMSLLGHLSELAMNELRADKAILSVRGIHIPDGITGDHLPGAALTRDVIGKVSEVIIVAEVAQWGSSGPAFLTPLEAVDVIVTGLDAPPAMVWDLTELGIKIIQV